MSSGGIPLRGLGRQNSLLACMFLAAVTFFVYEAVTRFGFVNWDDGIYVYRNASIRSLNLSHIWTWFTSPFAGLYVPVPLFSYAVDYALYGGNIAPGFHSMNLLIHTMNVLLVFMLFRRFFSDRLLCFLGALIFAVHPAQVETVAWISQRKNLLFTLFFLLGFLCGIQCYRAPRKRFWVAAAVLFFILSLFSKVTAVMIPFVILLYDYYYSGLGKRQGTLVSLFLLVPAFAMGMFTLMLYPEAVAGVKWKTVMVHFLDQGLLFYRYLQTILFPHSLKMLYERGSFLALSPVMKSVVGVLLAALAVLVIHALWNKKKHGFWLCFFLLMMLPVVNIFRVPRSDHHLYLPLIGIIGAVMSAGTRFPKLIRGVLVGAALVCIPLTRARLGVWQNSETLWESLIPYKHSRYIAQMQLAGYYEDRGELDKAKENYWAVLRGRPVQPEPYLNLYAVYERQGRKGSQRRLGRYFRLFYSTRQPLATYYNAIQEYRHDPERVRALLDQMKLDYDTGAVRKKQRRRALRGKAAENHG